jgi:thermitase
VGTGSKTLVCERARGRAVRHFNVSCIARAAGAVLGTLLASAPLAASAQSPGTSTQEWAPGRILVMPRAGLPDTELDKVVRVHGGKARRVGQSQLHIVDLPPTASEKAVVERLAHNPHLKFAELDMRVQPSAVTNDPYLGSEWHLDKIGASAAWDFTHGAGVTIAVLDTGVDASHPDLSGRIVPGWNFYNNSSNTADVKGHGTWVSGVAAATNNNGLGIASVAGQARIMPIRISDSSGVGYWSMIAQGITYAADHGARIANVSYDKLLMSSAIVSAANYMKSKGGLVVVAAGNSGANENLTPSTSMISVSATDSNDLKTSFSSYGSYVSLAAPGINIYCTTPGGGYSQCLGTSFASPVVAGTAALMMSVNPRLTGAQVESLLFSTAVDLGANGRDIYFGHGRVNAAAAVKAAVGTTLTADTQDPSVTISAPYANSSVSGIVPVNLSASDNVGVTKVELRVNGALAATDTASPFAFSWDSTKSANGMATFTAVAYDAAGNSTTSAPVAVNVANTTATAPTTDTTAPVVNIVSPGSGQLKRKGGVTISTSASDNLGEAGITQSLYIDDVLQTKVIGGSLSYSWNVGKVSPGSHTIKVVAVDKSNNASSASMVVSK